MQELGENEGDGQAPLPHTCLACRDEGRRLYEQRRKNSSSQNNERREVDPTRLLKLTRAFTN
jgi:hypothetical protein